MPVIKTRYRDLPWQEVKECALPEHALDRERSAWQAMRGEPVSFVAPALAYRPRGFQCSGPFFDVYPSTLAADGRAKRVVCPHIAEIGD